MNQHEEAIELIIKSLGSKLDDPTVRNYIFQRFFYFQHLINSGVNAKKVSRPNGDTDSSVSPSRSQSKSLPDVQFLPVNPSAKINEVSRAHQENTIVETADGEEAEIVSQSSLHRI